MTSLNDLLGTLPQVGSVVWIGLRPSRRVTPISVDEVEARVGEGLVGDRFSGTAKSTRQVTLIQVEHLAVIAQLLSRERIDPALLRRNVVVRGINLLALNRARFTIGSAVFEASGGCHPCSRMEEALGPGGYNAVRGHGGITARVIVNGSIKLDDPVSLLEAGQLGQHER